MHEQCEIVPEEPTHGELLFDSLQMSKVDVELVKDASISYPVLSEELTMIAMCRGKTFDISSTGHFSRAVHHLYNGRIRIQKDAYLQARQCG